MKVAGVILIDLTRARLGQRRDAASTARGIIWSAIADVPAGVGVRMLVPAWDPSWCHPAIDLLLEYGEDHIGAVTVEGDATAVANWITALRHARRVHGAGGDRARH
jgi:hypothetical protein